MRQRIRFLMSKIGKRTKITALTLGLLSLATTVWSYASPAGGWAQDVYNVAVTNVLQGPIGFVAGVGSMAAGAVFGLQQRIFTGVVCFAAGAVLMNAETLVTALGALF